MTYDFLIPCGGCLLAFLCLILAVRANRKKRLVDDLPTSKTTGVFIGLVELKGTSESADPLTSQLAEQHCVHYEYSVDEHWSRIVTETYTDSQGKTKTRTRTESGWTTVDSGGQAIPFYLEDDHGIILVRPDGAKIQPTRIFNTTCGRSHPLYYGKGPTSSVANSDHRRRFVETALPLHRTLYIMGRARERDDIVAPEIAYDKEAPMFLISTKSEEAVSRGLWWVYFWWAFFGLLLCVAGFLIHDIVSEISWQERIWVYALAVGGYAFSLMIGWVWMVYNSLINLRQRVKQGWSLIDIQLKRRHDLIPSLVNIVSALKEHERDLQTDVAELRSQAGVTAPGDGGSGPRAVGSRLIAIAEAYPELKTNESFLNLQNNLIDAEQRIALARGYYNDIASFYNTRLEVIPDRLMAKIARLKPRDLMMAAEFERAPVEVKFVD